MKNGFVRLGAIGLLTFVGSDPGSAFAGPTYTTINAPAGGEPAHGAIMQTIYGGAWTATGPSMLDMTRNPTGMLASRVADAGVSSPLALSSGSAPADDSVFAGQTVTITARAKHAGDKHIFGWIDDTQASPAFQSIVSSTTMNSPVIVALSSSFRWALKDTTTGLMFTSRPGDNAGVGTRAAERFDQLVTYSVTGAGGPGSEWALFWEDRVAGQGSADYDYNDVVVTVNAIPAPGAGMLGAVGLALLGRRRRR